MPSTYGDSQSPIIQFRDCRLLYKHRIVKEDLWVRDGKILDPEKLFYDEKAYADIQCNCYGKLIAPGFIDVQINGCFGVDFSSNIDEIEGGLQKVAHGLLAHGVTSFCPTIITSSKEIYKRILPMIRKTKGCKNGAGILGTHLEGPFINREKNGAHPVNLIKSYDQNGFKDVLDIYQSLDNVAIVTLAPEIDRSDDVIKELRKRGVIVSVGHSMGNLTDAENAAKNGATFITHLFNAMLPFHHRDPGIVGLLTSSNIPENSQIFYGMIADGIHTHPAALRIAHRAHPDGIVLITDAMAAMGLPPGRHYLGSQTVEIVNNSAYIAGTSTLAGSIATMQTCVKHFKQASGCTTVDALEAASLHPAQLLDIAERKGTLDYGTDADFIFLDDDLNVQSTYIAGEVVWQRQGGYPVVSRKRHLNSMELL
ncbi:N-acetylglucosamine-6-phosphate deacetylase-like [Anneissia japonica]|uniref:N-acetylglucosamine-6-phosphate deacetylase-like n=1 Tax=Anneissia japonica TaxID=1529436 RepID=UPI0014259009|nr:N-acetylglucosamine-6-phosphate deacetylase-like [Anneissia japonica]